MSAKTEEERPAGPVSRTLIAFDLLDELTPEQLEKFRASAEKAHAANLTEHFLNLTLRAPEEAA